MKPKLTDLTSEQKRIICAEACGWKRCACGDTEHCDVWYGPEEYATPTIGVSNYDESLDAMAEAVGTLEIVDRRVFAECLVKVCAGELPGDVLGDAFVIYNASASQRLDAFLLAKGLAE